MLSRRALATVLQSLLAAELLVARGRGNPDTRLPTHLPSIWPEAMRIDGGSGEGLGCDSLERLWLAAAVNETFHLHEAAGEDGLLTDTTFGAWIDRVEAAWRSGGRHDQLYDFGNDRAAEAVRPCRGVPAHRSRVPRRPVPGQEAGRLSRAGPSRLRFPVRRAPTGRARRRSPRRDPPRPRDLARSLAPGDLVVTFPERWRWLERSLPAWPEDVEGVVSTAPCPPDLIAALHDRGLSAMTEVYGSSETAGVAVRRWPEASYRLMPHWRFVEPVREDLPAIVDRSGRRIALPDGIRLRDGDRFRLSGRLDGAVQVGGINVFPDRVAAGLRALPGVRDAAVRLMRAEEGSRLKAFIVPETGADPTHLRSSLDAWIDTALQVAERPVAITFGPAVPTTVIGKAADW